MKKIISFLITLISIFFINVTVKAANATISITGNNSAVVGNTVTVSVTVSSATSLGSWDFTVGYDTSKLRLTYSDAESSQRAVHIKIPPSKWQMLGTGTSIVLGIL